MQTPSFAPGTRAIRWLPLVFALSAGCAYVDVPPGHVAVDWTLNGMNPQVYKEGEWGIGYYDKATIFDARSQEREERLYVLASNGERIVLDASIRYHIIPDQAVQLDQELGTHYYSILIGPTLRSQARRVLGRYHAEDIYSKQREAIEREIRDGVETAIKGRHIVLEAILIRDVTLPEQVQEAINNKLQKEQQMQQQQYEIETAKLVAERNKVEADSEAAQARIRAQGAADAKRIAAQATSDYERLIQQNITPDVLKWQQIQAMDHLAESPNAKVIMMGDGKATPLLEVK